MDFVHDQLVTGRAFRVLTVIDQWSRHGRLRDECLNVYSFESIAHAQ